jgi:hypothetical protein
MCVTITQSTEDEDGGVLCRQGSKFCQFAIYKMILLCIRLYLVSWWVLCLTNQRRCSRGKAQNAFPHLLVAFLIIEYFWYKSHPFFKEHEHAVKAIRPPIMYKNVAYIHHITFSVAIVILCYYAPLLHYIYLIKYQLVMHFICQFVACFVFFAYSYMLSLSTIM